MNEIERRLKAIAVEPPGRDWNDVLRRAGRDESARRRAVVGGLALAACLLLAVPALAFRSWLGDVLSLSSSDEPLPSGDLPHAAVPAYVAGRRLVLPSRTLVLKAPLLAPLLGQDVPLAFESPDGRRVVYHTWNRQTPILRSIDTRSGRDTVVARGAQSAAWRADGALAFTAGDPPRYVPNGTWAGRVVVRAPSGVTSTWLRTKGRYRVAGWAGPRLLVESDPSNVVSLVAPVGTLVVTGPGRFRNVGEGGVSAISPDGRFFFGRIPNGDGLSDRVRIVDTLSARTVASARLSTLARSAGLDPRGLEAGVFGQASWRASRIVAVTTFTRSTALLVLRYSGGKLSLARVLRLDRNAGLKGPFGVSFSVPRQLDDGTRVVVRADVPLADDKSVSYFVTCDLRRSACVRGKALRPALWMAIVERLRP